MSKANVVSRVLAVIGCIALSATVAHAGAGSGEGGPTIGGFQCYVIDGQEQTRVVTLDDQFGSHDVHVGEARLLCTPVQITKSPDTINTPDFDSPKDAVSGELLTLDHLKCYTISPHIRPTPRTVVKIRDGLDNETLRVHRPQLLCTGANKECLTGACVPQP